MSNPAAAVFLSGQIALQVEDIVSMMGFDGIMADVPTALDMMNRHWNRIAQFQ